MTETTFSLEEPPLFTRLKGCQSILIAGAGGGFDVYAGLPLAFSLQESGKRVYLANLSFADLYALDSADWIDSDVATVRPGSRGHSEYFPERTLARWLERMDMDAVVYAFPRAGVRPLRDAYQALIEHLGGVDAIVLVDGGTDILMRGDEAGLGTPEEDMTSLAAVHGLPTDTAPRRLVACIGFGVDAYHGVNHVLALENLAALDAEGGYLGAFSVPRNSREAVLYLDAVAFAQDSTQTRPSIVNGSIAAAVRGEFGDVRFTKRTSNSGLFINPLMSMYFVADLGALARRNLYLDRLEDTTLLRQVSGIIETFRYDLRGRRPPRQYPHLHAVQARRARARVMKESTWSAAESMNSAARGRDLPSSGIRAQAAA